MLLTHAGPVSRQLGVFDKLEQAALAVARHRGTVSTEEKEGVGEESRAPKARKKRRRITRQKKAAAIAPRPTSGLLRPAVRPPHPR